MDAGIRKGMRFGAWRLTKQLGGGGNGVVWAGQNSKGRKVAIKILANPSNKSQAKAYARFRTEVTVIRANGDIRGVLPMLDFSLPETVTEQPPWYAMPVAQPLDKYLSDKKYDIAIKAVSEVAKTLVTLHERGICHRDIKPENILVGGSNVFLADFGLATYPGKLDVTSTGEQIGAKWTIAPEMKRNGHKADGKAADVYSLAKTLWILLTRNKWAFDGQYDPESVNGLSRFRITEPEENGMFFLGAAPTIYTQPLDDLLKASTDNDPKARPIIREFVEQLSLWVSIYKDYQKRNPRQWRDAHAKLFPTAVPQRTIWTDTTSIIDVLSYLGSVNGLNHMHVPGGGGVDLVGAQIGVEPGTIELHIVSGTVYIVKPKRLVFESFGFDMEWNYFILETGGLKPTGIGAVMGKYEMLRRVGPTEYISEDNWFADREQKRKYPSNASVVLRFKEGSFLIIQKTGIYNRIGDTYDGRHDQQDTDKFREYISNKTKLVQRVLRDKRAINAAKKAGMTMQDFAFGFIAQAFRADVFK